MSDHPMTSCPSCRGDLRIKEKYRGKAIRCRGCRSVVRVSKHDRIDCPECRAELRVVPDLLGQAVTCHHCKANFRAPGSGRVKITLVGSEAMGDVASPPPSGVEATADGCPECLSAREEAAIAREEADQLREFLAGVEADRQQLRERLDVRAGELDELDSLRQAARASRESEAASNARIDELLAWASRAEDELSRLDEGRTEAIRQRDLAREGLALQRSRAEALARSLREAHGRWGADRRRWRSEVEALLGRIDTERRESARRIAEALESALEAEEARQSPEDRLARQTAGLEQPGRDRQPEGPAGGGQSDRLALVEERDELARELDRLGSRVAELQADRDRLAAERDRLDEAHRGASDRAESACRERDEISRRFEQLARDRSEAEASLLASLDRLTRELEAVRVERARFEKTVEYFNTMARKAGSDRDQLRAALEETKRRLDQALADRLSLQDRLASIALQGSTRATTDSPSTSPPPSPSPKAPEPVPGGPDRSQGGPSGRRERPEGPGTTDRAGFIDLALANWDGVDPS
jgi:uncharacterized protein YbaR (Trm112 family)